jgi:surface polysaccharide O-acyltransferase-like enzyme
MKPAATNQSTRLFFLDWVRIIAFFILILYHVGMYYVTWGWHVKSQFASDAIEPYMNLSSPWRLGLLFLVSGVASSFMLARLPAARFARQRSTRLLVPLLFGILVIVPPQSYFEVVEKLAYAGGYGDFMRLYLAGYHGFCREDCLILPTWNHLWFVLYLWVYTMLLAVIVPALGARFDALAGRVADMLAGWKLVALPAAVLVLAHVTLHARFPQTHALVDDWFNHAVYLFLFLLGTLFGRAPRVWAHVEAQRWAGLGIALASWAALTILYALPETAVPKPLLEALRPVMHAVYALCTWSAIVAACGFARRHLQFDSPARRYLTEAVFPVYIMHQTLIVSLAHALKPLRLPPGQEAFMLVVLTVTLSFGVFELVRRSALLRPLFGLARLPAPLAAPRPLAAGAA